MKTIEERATQERELRVVTVSDNGLIGRAFEIREADDGKVTFDGIASVVDTPYTVRDMFGEYEETISKGAFTKTLKEKSDVRLLINHDGTPLARTKSKTLSLSAAPDLRAVAELDPANPKVQEIRSALSRGDMDQMSIGFRVHRQEWNEDYTQRSIKEVELFDVSLVTYPASPTTSASLRSIAELFELDLTDAPDDEIRRAIAFLEARLAPPASEFDPAAARERLELLFAQLARHEAFALPSLT